MWTRLLCVDYYFLQGKGPRARYGQTKNHRHSAGLNSDKRPSAQEQLRLLYLPEGHPWSSSSGPKASAEWRSSVCFGQLKHTRLGGYRGGFAGLEDPI